MRETRTSMAPVPVGRRAALQRVARTCAPLVDWILEALAAYPESFEVILVDDGSRDDTWARIAAAAAA